MSIFSHFFIDEELINSTQERVAASTAARTPGNQRLSPMISENKHHSYIPKSRSNHKCVWLPSRKYPLKLRTAATLFIPLADRTYPRTWTVQLTGKFPTNTVLLSAVLSSTLFLFRCFAVAPVAELTTLFVMAWEAFFFCFTLLWNNFWSSSSSACSKAFSLTRNEQAGCNWWEKNKGFGVKVLKPPRYFNLHLKLICPTLKFQILFCLFALKNVFNYSVTWKTICCSQNTAFTIYQ